MDTSAKQKHRPRRQPRRWQNEVLTEGLLQAKKYPSKKARRADKPIRLPRILLSVILVFVLLVLIILIVFVLFLVLVVLILLVVLVILVLIVFHKNHPAFSLYYLPTG